jgi:hypothetical protein
MNKENGMNFDLNLQNLICFYDIRFQRKLNFDD